VADELERLKARRVTALYRLDLIGKGAQLFYDDGTSVDMRSEQVRLEEMVADLDRRIARLEATLH
jgi:lipoate synthase